MIPQKIRDQLSRVLKRDMMFQVAWGAAIVLAAGWGALMVGSLLDWIIDRYTETPKGLRVLMLLGHLALWAVLIWKLVVAKVMHPRSEAEVALWIEERVPALGHRLITAVELNRPEANRQGMSPELIDAATRQAEEQAAAQEYDRLVDPTPVKQGAGILGATAVLVILLALTTPLGVLLGRQFLSSAQIPRSVTIESLEAVRVVPKGDEILLEFRAESGEALENMSGTVRIELEGRAGDTFEIVHSKSLDGNGALFTARIPPVADDFEYRAWLGDGRTKKPARIDVEPRPVVQNLEGWVILPEYVGKRADGSRYMPHRPRGDLDGPKGSGARVAATTSKPVVKATLELLGRKGKGITETLLSSREMKIREDGSGVEGTFDFAEGMTAYRVVVEDKHGFRNATPPRRTVTLVADEPPKVVLLPERFTMGPDALITEESEVAGMPIPIGKSIRIAYYCQHPYGLSHARLGYRIIKSGDSFSSGTEIANIPWTYLPLAEVRETKESGQFDLRRGAFAHSGFRDQIEFHPTPSPDPARIPGRLEGGGRFDFQTSAIPELGVGDQIEFFVEVFAANPDLARFPGRSETRSKMFVTRPDFVRWIINTLKHESRIRQLENRQRGVFTPEADF